MFTGVKRLGANPLIARETLRWRRRAPWALPAAAVVMLLSCAAVNAPLLATLVDNADITDVIITVSVIASAVSCLLGLAWFAVQVATPVLAGMSTSQLYSSGMGDALRLTLLTGRDVVDAYFVRTLLRFPFWLIVAPLLPLAAAGVTSSTMLLGFGGLGTPGSLGVDLDAGPVTWIVMLAYPLISVLGRLVQLAACIEIGILAGMHNRTPGNAAAITIGGLFVFQLIIPMGCGLCLSIVQVVALGAFSGGGYSGLDSPADLTAYTLIITLGSVLVQALYQAAVFFIARMLAAQKFDRAEV